MSGGLFGTGTSALLSYQRALQVTGHNIANVGTEGFSRQRLDLVTRTPEMTGFGALGTGVAPASVSRVVDAFVEIRLGMNLSAEAYERTYAEFAAQLDGLLADPGAGLTPALGRLFAAVEDVATDPTSTAARQQLISEAQALVDRFAQLEGRIADQRAIVGGRIASSVEEINQLAAGVAELNARIVEARGRLSGREPNDLLDQRDVLVRQLAERVAVNTVEQSDGSVNVYIGRGQALVIGNETSQLLAGPMGADPNRLEILLRSGASNVPVTEFMSGGSLGAMLELRDQLLDPASNALGRVAIALVEGFNELHTAGMDLRGQLGQPFFGLPAPEILAQRSNAATGLPALEIRDPGALEASDYQLRFNGTDWVVRRLADGRTVGTIPAGGTLEFDGLDLDLSGVGSASAGDTFLLRPARVAGGLEVLVTDPRAVAAALPVRAEADPANSGSARVLALTVSDSGDAALRDPVSIEFSGGNYLVNGTPVPPDPSGDTVLEANGWRLVLRGTPAEGDVFEVVDNAGGIGDNRGALALAGLALDRRLAGGTATLAESYAALVSEVGVKTRRAKINADVQGRLLAEARSQRENISGVNLDEEAANLLRYQQAYQASAQMIAVAGSLFDTLLAAVRR